MLSQKVSPGSTMQSTLLMTELQGALSKRNNVLSSTLDDSLDLSTAMSITDLQSSPMHSRYFALPERSVNVPIIVEPEATPGKQQAL